MVKNNNIATIVGDAHSHVNQQYHKYNPNDWDSKVFIVEIVITEEGMVGDVESGIGDIHSETRLGGFDTLEEAKGLVQSLVNKK